MSRAEFVVSAGGIVLRDHDVLLVRVGDVKGRAVWTFPKGRLNDGETVPMPRFVRWKKKRDGAAGLTENWPVPIIGFSAKDGASRKRCTGSE